MAILTRMKYLMMVVFCMIVGAVISDPLLASASPAGGLVYMAAYDPNTNNVIPATLYPFNVGMSNYLVVRDPLNLEYYSLDSQGVSMDVALEVETGVQTITLTHDMDTESSGTVTSDGTVDADGVGSYDGDNVYLLFYNPNSSFPFAVYGADLNGQFSVPSGYTCVGILNENTGTIIEGSYSGTGISSSTGTVGGSSTGSLGATEGDITGTITIDPGTQVYGLRYSRDIAGGNTTYINPNNLSELTGYVNNTQANNLYLFVRRSSFLDMSNYSTNPTLPLSRGASYKLRFQLLVAVPDVSNFGFVGIYNSEVTLYDGAAAVYSGGVVGYEMISAHDGTGYQVVTLEYNFTVPDSDAFEPPNLSDLRLHINCSNPVTAYSRYPSLSEVNNPSYLGSRLDALLDYYEYNPPDATDLNAQTDAQHELEAAALADAQDNADYVMNNVSVGTVVSGIGYDVDIGGAIEASGNILTFYYTLYDWIAQIFLLFTFFALYRMLFRNRGGLT